MASVAARPRTVIEYRQPTKDAPVTPAELMRRTSGGAIVASWKSRGVVTL